MKKLKPDIYQKDIFGINYKKLKENNIKLLIFDIDDTIVASNKKKIDDKTIEFFNELKKDFDIKLVTNAFKIRANKFKEALGLECYTLSLKPSIRNIKKAMKGYKKDEVIIIGDKVGNDVLAAKKAGVMSALVDPINKVCHFPMNIIRFFKEDWLVKDLEKKSDFKKGKYYE